MFVFILRRLLIGVVLLFLISVISFFIITLTPGSPYPWGELNLRITPQVKEAFKKKFHLDRPLHEQYLLNMRDACRMCSRPFSPLSLSRSRASGCRTWSSLAW